MKRVLEERIGTRLGRLVCTKVIRSAGERPRLECICDCGRRVVIIASNFKEGKTVSCGCLRTDRAKEMGIKHSHGMAYSKEYAAWKSMRQRCMNPANKFFHHYGGRGIIVCKRWLSSFENFFADMGRAKPGQSLDRIDVDGDYTPENCRWTDNTTQHNNTRTNVFIEFNGKAQSVAQWAKETGIKENTLRGRLSRGWSIERALTR